MTGRIAWALAAALLCFAPARAEASGADEADRQMGFARGELAVGDFHGALRSAESALRLDPTRYDAFLLKARAYEGLGDLELAESLVRAYGELVGGLDDRPEAQAILDRVGAARAAAEEQPRTRTALLRRRIELTEVPVEIPDAVDPEPYRERVLAALAEGRCATASSAATELTMSAPGLADGWKLAGDAARCAGDLHGALLAYRRYQREGGAEASTVDLIDRLAGKYATLLVVVDAPPEASPIRARLTVGDEEFLAEPTPEGTLRLRDLRPAQGMSLTVSGRGLRPITLSLEPAAAGETRTVEVAPEWLGLATVRVADYGPPTQVQLLTEDAEVVAEANGAFVLSAAAAWALVENEFGVQSIELAVEPDGEVAFDPAPYLPSRLAVAGAPAGATVAVEVTADDGRVGGWSYVLPGDVGEIDPATGVRVAPVRNFDSLPGGIGTLRVEHPALGEAEVEVVLETGALNAVTFDWRPLPGVRTVAERYGEWQAGQARVERARGRTAGLGVASGVLAAVGGGLLVGALVAQGEADAARDAAVAAHAGGDSAGLTAAIGDFDAARARQHGLGIAAGIGFGVAGVGVVVTLGSGGSARRSQAETRPWTGSDYYGD